jgi:hypothetical protein
LKKAAQELLLCWAMGCVGDKPTAQHKKVFLLLFVHKKKPSFSCAKTLQPAGMCDRYASFAPPIADRFDFELIALCHRLKTLKPTSYPQEGYRVDKHSTRRVRFHGELPQYAVTASVCHVSSPFALGGRRGGRRFSYPAKLHRR